MQKTSSPSGSVRFARWSVALLVAINLLNYIDRQVLSAVTTQIKGEFHASDEQLGWLTTAFLVSYMCAAPLFGWLSDWMRRWAIVGIGVILWSLASGASGLAGSIRIMLFTRLFVGVGEAAYGPTAPTIISDLFPIEKRGRIMALFYAAIPVGSALGYLLGGQVLAMELNWRWAFFIVVVPGLILGVLAILMREPPRPAAEKRHHATWREFIQLAKIPSFVLTTIGMAAMTFALGGIAAWMPKFVVWKQGIKIVEEPLVLNAAIEAPLAAVVAPALHLAHDLVVNDATAAANRTFGPIVVVSGLLATLAGGWLGDRLRPKWSGSYFIVSGVAALLGFPLVWGITVAPFPAAWYLIFLACCCLFFNTGPTNTILANVTKPSIRAAAFAINIFLIHVFGDAISPPLIGAINDANGGNMNPGFVTVSFSILVGGIAWLAGARFLARDTARAESQDDDAEGVSS